MAITLFSLYYCILYTTPPSASTDDFPPLLTYLAKIVLICFDDYLLQFY